MTETRAVKDLASGDVIRVDGFDDDMTIRAAKKVKKGLDAGKFHVTLAAPDGETEVIALDPEERVKVVPAKMGVEVTGPAAGKKGAKDGNSAGKAKGKAKTKATSEPETQTSAAPLEPAEASAPAPERDSVTPKKVGQHKKTDGDKKLSAIDAAVKVLTEAGTSMSCQEMIQAMAEKGYWTSPGGKTPAGTLYSAILRELQTKGTAARFRKTERGKFAAHNCQ
jgi:HB1, ASXL, restriction endonuclease HTH domain